MTYSTFKKLLTSSSSPTIFKFTALPTVLCSGGKKISQKKSVYQCEQVTQNSVLPHAFTSLSFFPSFFFCRFIFSLLQIIHLNQCYLSNIIVHRSVASHLKRLRGGKKMS